MQHRPWTFPGPNHVLKFLIEFSHIGLIGRFHDDLDLDGSIFSCAHAFLIMVCRMPSFLGLAGLLLFRLILVVLVVGDALVNVLEEVFSKLLDLAFTLFSVIMVEILLHDPVAVHKRLSIGVEFCDDAAWIDGVF